MGKKERRERQRREKAAQAPAAPPPVVKPEEKAVLDTLIEAGLSPKLAEAIRANPSVAKRASRLISMSMRSLDDQAPIEDVPQPAPVPAPRPLPPALAKEGSGGIRRPKVVVPVNDHEQVGIHRIADFGIQRPIAPGALVASPVTEGSVDDQTTGGTIDEFGKIRSLAVQILWKKGIGAAAGYPSLEAYAASIPRISAHDRNPDNAYPCLAYFEPKLDLFQVCQVLGINLTCNGVHKEMEHDLRGVSVGQLGGWNRLQVSLGGLSGRREIEPSHPLAVIYAFLQMQPILMSRGDFICPLEITAGEGRFGYNLKSAGTALSIIEWGAELKGIPANYLEITVRPR